MNVIGERLNGLWQDFEKGKEFLQSYAPQSRCHQIKTFIEDCADILNFE